MNESVDNKHIDVLLDKYKVPDYDKGGELTTYGRVNNVLDELATLRAQNVELVEALKAIREPHNWIVYKGELVATVHLKKIADDALAKVKESK